jgi:hypothetical protein
MPSHYKIDHIIDALPRPRCIQLPAPPYQPSHVAGRLNLPNVGLAVESMKRHMTDEGMQIFQALESAGYSLYGYGLPNAETDVQKILSSLQVYPTLPAAVNTIVVQDKREWEGLTADRSRDPRMRFKNISCLTHRPDVFRVTILKDAHQQTAYHLEAAVEMGAHAWICYYEPRLVAHQAPYVRPEHLIRTYHTVDPELVPGTVLEPDDDDAICDEEEGKHGWSVAPYGERPKNCLISGAVSAAYPLRARLVQDAATMPEGMLDVLRHPGYHRNGCCTPDYLQVLSCYKVAVCTVSRYGYFLRKIVEATACGCMVLTDLPEDEHVPEIDDNLARVSPHWPTTRIANILKEMAANWDPERQRQRAERCLNFYDWRIEGKRLAGKIEETRRSYGQG